MMGRHIAHGMIKVGVLAAFAAVLPACPKDPFDAATWIEKLDSDDGQEFQNALTELGRLKDPKSLKPLGQAWQKKDMPEQMLRMIISIADQQNRNTIDPADPRWVGHPNKLKVAINREYGPYWENGPYWDQAVEFLQRAVEVFLDDDTNSRAISNATLALESLGRAKEQNANVDAGGIKRVAVKQMSVKAAGQKVRLAAVKALRYFVADDPSAVDTLIQVVQEDPETFEPRTGEEHANYRAHVALLAAAADSLAYSHSGRAIQPLLVAMYKLPMIYPFCRRALVAIGKPAIPVLRQILNLQHREMNELAQEHKFSIRCDERIGPQSSCRAPTNLEFKAASILGDLHAREAVPDLLAGLKKKPLPAFFAPNGAPGPSQHEAILNALKTIADPGAADDVYRYWSDSSVDEELRPVAIDTYSFLTTDTGALDKLGGVMKDNNVDVQSRIASGMTYGRLVRGSSDLAPLKWMVEQNRKRAEDFKKDFEKANRQFEEEKEARDRIQAKLDEFKRKQQTFFTAEETAKRTEAQIARLQEHRVRLEAQRKRVRAGEKAQSLDARIRAFTDELDSVSRERTEARKAMDKFLVSNPGFSSAREDLDEDLRKAQAQYEEKERAKFVAEGSMSDYRNFQRIFEQHLARAGVGIDCGDKVDCYIGYLKASDEQILAKLAAQVAEIRSWSKDRAQAEKRNSRERKRERAAGKLDVDKEKQRSAEEAAAKQHAEGLRIAAMERALLELAKMGPRARSAEDILREKLSETDRLIRTGSLLALSKVAVLPCDKCVDKLDQVIENDEGKSTLDQLTSEAKVWRYYFTWAGKK